MKPVKLFGKQWAFDGFLPGEQRGSLEGFSVEQELLTITTPYQTLSVVENEEYGRILFLNGFLQLAQMGEEVYHEMLVHPALLSHPRPERVLIIGGGDGGVLREVLKHPVQNVVLVEIDKKVIEVSKKYFPALSQGAFEDPRAAIVIGDGKEVLGLHERSFDCVILDSNDPDGEMAGELFSSAFFEKVKRALKQDGIFIAQTGYLGDAFGKTARENMKQVFSAVWMHRAFVRYYRANEHSFSLASMRQKYQKVALKTLERRFQKRNLATHYYSPAMHIASGILPTAFKREIEEGEKKMTSWAFFLRSLGTKLKATSRK